MLETFKKHACQSLQTPSLLKTVQTISKLSMILIHCSHFFQADEDVQYFNERYINGEFQIMFDELNADISQFEIIKSIKEIKTS